MPQLQRCQCRSGRGDCYIYDQTKNNRDWSKPSTRVPGQVCQRVELHELQVELVDGDMCAAWQRISPHLQFSSVGIEPRCCWTQDVPVVVKCAHGCAYEWAVLRPYSCAHNTCSDRRSDSDAGHLQPYEASVQPCSLLRRCVVAPFTLLEEDAS